MAANRILDKGGVPMHVFTEDIDEASIEQLGALSRLEIVSGRVAVMPDVHVGIEATTGSVVPTVVKPLAFVNRGERGLLAPALKCRGREYLPIIYEPEYTREDQMVRLRKRTVGRKMALAQREFALRVESLEQFVQRAPLRRVHKAAFGVLALEAEPLDPRL